MGRYRSDDFTRRLITGQHVTDQKREVSRRLRSQMTPAEEKLWHALRRSQLQGLHFRRQQIIGGLIADFYCHAKRLVVEVDGAIHDGQAEYDADRDELFTQYGLTVLRIRNDEVLEHLDQVLQRILQAAGLQKDES